MKKNLVNKYKQWILRLYLRIPAEVVQTDVSF